MSAIELIKLSEENAEFIFLKEKGLDNVIGAIKEVALDESKGVDATTPEGRKRLKSIAMSVSKSKTYLDGISKRIVKELKRKPNIIIAESNRMKNILDDFKDEIKKPAVDFENKEKERVERINLDLSIIEAFGKFDGPSREGRIELEKLTLLTVTEDKFEEFFDHAQDLYKNSVSFLNIYIAKKEKEEAEKEELEQLRKEKEERDEKERILLMEKEREERERILIDKAKEEESARKESEAREREAKLIREKEDAERKLVEQEERAEREKIEAENEIIRKEKITLELKEEKERQEQMKREKASQNIEYRRSINQEILEKLEAIGIDGNYGKEIIKGATFGELGKLTIQY